jgi:hypothetical protein
MPNLLPAAARVGSGGKGEPSLPLVSGSVPKFAANVGIAGLEKWARLLTDTRNPKGWGRVFGQGRDAAIGATRLYDCINHAYTAPGASRPLYAELLAEAAPLVDDPTVTSAAGSFAASGERWGRISALITGADPTLARYAELSDLRAAAIDDDPRPASMASLRAEQDELVAASSIPPSLATDLHIEIGGWWPRSSPSSGPGSSSSVRSGCGKCRGR